MGTIGSRSFQLFVLVAIISIGRASCINQEGKILLEFKQQAKDPTNILHDWNAGDQTPCNWTGITCEDDRVAKILIHGAQLQGSIVPSLSRLPFLHILSLAKNNFSGEIPAQISDFSVLWKLNLSGNSLSGGIPLSLGRIPSLRMLDLSRNQLTGIIPEQIFQGCERFHYISLAENSFQGRFPASIGNCVNLDGIDFSSNKLLGSIPPSLGQLASLRYLSLQGNRFTGSIPPELGSCGALEILDLSSNSLQGSVPSDLGRLSSLTELYLYRNILSGTFPAEVLYLPSLGYLNASGNSFDGDISRNSVQLGGCQKLMILDLSSNRLNGDVSENLFDCLQLQLLNLSHNRLRHVIPHRIGGLVSLHSLDLSSNNLGGTIPVEVSNLLNMTLLDLGSNPIGGDIPSGICNSAGLLQVINLDNMRLHGEIPPTIGQCKFLLTLNLSNNQLEGTIPTSFKDVQYLNTLELQHNKLGGSIPRELGGLGQLKKLDLSFNMLTGMIPSDLGGIVSLTNFNVSYNNLTGLIPRSGSLSRCNSSSYAGNPFLCGLPLSLKCAPIVSGAPSPAPAIFPPAKRRRRHVLSLRAYLAIGIATLIVLGVVIVFICNMWARKKKRQKTELLVYESSPDSPPTSPKIGKFVLFSTTIQSKQENWNQGMKALVDKDSVIGYGPLGTVYKAVVDGMPIAVKRLEHLGGVESQQEFEREVAGLGNLRHRNLVTFEGYYWSSNMKVLISEYIPNDSLFHHLHDRLEGQPALPWWRRFNIAQGTARALAYLHHDCHPPIKLFNLKATNILLDDEFEPRVSDFGLGKMLPKPDAEAYVSDARLREALGYMAPEMAVQNPGLTEKCDVYSFGVVLLELVTGRRPVENLESDIVILCEYVRKLVSEKRAERCIDPDLIGSPFLEQETMPLLRLGLACTSQEPSKRPTMAEVVQMLELQNSRV